MSPSKPVRQRPGGASKLTASKETLRVGDAGGVSTAPFQQPPTPAPSPEPEPAAPAAEETPAPPKKTTEPSSEPRQPASAATSARQAFEASAMLARKKPRQWKPYSVRLPEQLWARLRDRVGADQPSYGVTLAMSHYVNAALARAPRDVEAAVALAQEQMDAQGLHPPETHSSGTRLHQDVLKQMKELGAQMQQASQGGLLGHLQTAVIAAFLDELDAG